MASEARTPERHSGRMPIQPDLPRRFLRGTPFSSQGPARAWQLVRCPLLPRTVPGRCPPRTQSGSAGLRSRTRFCLWSRFRQTSSLTEGWWHWPLWTQVPGAAGSWKQRTQGEAVSALPSSAWTHMLRKEPDGPWSWQCPCKEIRLGHRGAWTSTPTRDWTGLRPLPHLHLILLPGATHSPPAPQPCPLPGQRPPCHLTATAGEARLCLRVSSCASDRLSACGNGSAHVCRERGLVPAAAPTDRGHLGPHSSLSSVHLLNSGPAVGQEAWPVHRSHRPSPQVSGFAKNAPECRSGPPGAAQRPAVCHLQLSPRRKGRCICSVLWP